MDRILEVVAGRVATDVAQAWAQLLELRRDEFHRPLDRVPGEQLTELYRRLLDHYPPFEEDPTTPWGETPMALYFGDRLASVPIIASRVADALPFVTKTATALGLTVFDVTGERIHRPDNDQTLPASLTAEAPWRDRLDDLSVRSTLRERPTPGPEKDQTRTNRAGMIVTGGCLLSLLALVSLWTALMLYTGWATSLAWGEGDTTWVRHDVPTLCAIALAALVSGATLLIVGARMKGA